MTDLLTEKSQCERVAETYINFCIEMSCWINNHENPCSHRNMSARCKYAAALRLRNKQGSPLECLASTLRIRHDRMCVARGGPHIVTKRDFSKLRFLLSQKRADNVPTMSLMH